MRSAIFKQVFLPAIAMVFVGALWTHAAQSLSAPEGSPILHVSGNIQNTNEQGVAVLDLAMLERIGVTRIQTSTPWTEGRPVFEGVLMRDLLAELGAEGDSVVAVALNDYRVEIPTSDFTQYPVILAYKMDGKRLRVRDKGPLWIIYPQDDYSELNTKQGHGRWAWQIKDLVIQ